MHMNLLKIFLMDMIQKGEIKEVGSHNELLSKDGIYKALYNKNFDNNIKS